MGANGLWEYSSFDHGGGNTSAVNTSTGNQVFTHSSGAIPARGFSVDLTHTYNSQDAYGQADYYDHAGAWYGEGWTFSQNLRLYEVANGYGVVFKDGSEGADRVFSFRKDTDGTRYYHAPLYYGTDLTEDIKSTPTDPKKVYTLAPESGGTKMYFDGGGKVRRIEDRNGNYLEYSYDTDGTSVSDPNGKLTTITDVAGRKTTLEYANPGGRLSKITDMAGRVHTYEISSFGNLLKINHWKDSTTALTTSFTYNVGYQLVSVTNPRGHTSYRNYYYKYGWETAGSTDDWAAEANTTVAQTTERFFSGSGSLKMNLTSVTDTASGGASRTFTTPVSWNSTQQELATMVYVPNSYSLHAKLLLTDSRGRVQAGPTFLASGGVWTSVRLPQAHIDPAYKIAKVRVQLTTPAGAAAYTGPVYLDHLMVRGITSSFGDASTAHNTVLRHTYD